MSKNLYKHQPLNFLIIYLDVVTKSAIFGIQPVQEIELHG